MNIVFFSLEGVGHMNACIGIAQVLKDAGHRVQFIISEQWRGRIARYGIEEVIISQQTRPQDIDPSTQSSDQFMKGGALDSETPLQKIIAIWTKVIPPFIQEVKDLDPYLDNLLKSLKPDVIVVDHVLCIPAIELSGIPWVYSCSFQPLMGFQMKSDIDDNVLPPYSSGMPIDSDKGEWKQFRDGLNQAIESLTDDYNKYVMSRGVPALDKYRFARYSDFMNIYGYPLELDYVDVRPLPPNWYRFDNLKRTSAVGKFEIPDELKNKPGKLVYLSMGTIGSGNLPMMNRLIGILAKSKHRFIVAKGPKHEQIQLADNMWGQPFVPQIPLLPLIDLLITHGGNNTITETFYFGKPMIVMPLFSDQLDNAQRVQEKGFGVRLDPFSCTEQQLLGAVEKLLNDKPMIEKLRHIGQRIQSENSIAKLPKLIEQRLSEYNKK